MTRLPKFKINLDLDRDFIEYVFEVPLTEQEQDQVNDYFSEEQSAIDLDWRDQQTVWIY